MLKFSFMIRSKSHGLGPIAAHALLLPSHSSSQSHSARPAQPRIINKNPKNNARPIPHVALPSLAGTHRDHALLLASHSASQIRGRPSLRQKTKKIQKRQPTRVPSRASLCNHWPGTRRGLRSVPAFHSAHYSSAAGPASCKEKKRSVRAAAGTIGMRDAPCVTNPAAPTRRCARSCSLHAPSLCTPFVQPPRSTWQRRRPACTWRIPTVTQTTKINNEGKMMVLSPFPTPFVYDGRVAHNAHLPAIA
jgi:hypothetical protein